jgi:TQXA domain-containing protein
LIDTRLPHSRRGRRVLAVAAASTAAALAFGFTAGPAFADGAKGTYTDNALNGPSVKTDQGEVSTSLFNLKLEDGTVLQTYCIDFETDIRRNAAYQEDAWANYPGKGEFTSPAKVHWILQNSYPTLSAADLATAAKVDGLSNEQAMAATQAAIWHFSNGVNLLDDNNAKVKAVYDYLVENAQDLPQTSEPDASLSITPATAEGTAGSTIGEFTIETSAASVPLNVDAPDGVELVDLETGEPVTEASSGDKLGFEVPADAAPGEASVSASVSAEVHAGRLFKGTEDKPTQTLITAESGEAEVSAAASVSWTEGTQPSPSPSPSTPPSESPSPSPTPSETPSPSPSETPDDRPTPDDDEDLPLTGAAIGGLVAAGVAAVGAGAAAMYLSRKRRGANGDSIDG